MAGIFILILFQKSYPNYCEYSIHLKSCPVDNFAKNQKLPEAMTVNNSL